MRRALYAVLMAGLFALLLSALVVSPEEGAELARSAGAKDFRAVFRPLITAVLPDAADVPRSSGQMRVFLCLLPPLLLCALPEPGMRDANGRVLGTGRYENSVYQLFRPETAGG